MDLHCHLLEALLDLVDNLAQLIYSLLPIIDNLLVELVLTEGLEVA